MWGTIYGQYKTIWVGNDFLFALKCHFFRIWWKNLIAAGVLRINIWFSLPVPKIKFDLPHKEKCFGGHILGLS